MASARDLEILLRATYPIIMVSTHEETRVEDAVLEITKTRNMSALAGKNPNVRSSDVFTWTVTSGLQRILAGNTSTPAIPVGQGDTKSPLAVLEFVNTYKGPAIFILKDLNHYMGEGAGITVQRRLKDLAVSLPEQFEKIGNKHVIIVGNIKDIPDDLEKIIALLDFDLPTRDEISEIFQDFLLMPELRAEKLELANKPVEYKQLIDATLGLTKSEIYNVIGKSIVSTKKLDVRSILSEKKHIIRKSGVLEFYEPSSGMENVGGLENLKAWLAQRNSAFSTEAKKFGLPPPKGVLLIGVPGTGKSLISKAVGVAWNMPVLRLDVGALFGSFIGQSESNMRKALKTAEAVAPCVLWIDELEKSLGPAQGTMDGGTSSRVFGYFLNWMQEKSSSVFVVATANDVSKLPPEMLRKGRFDEIFFSDLPTLEEREEILAIHVSRYGRDPSLFRYLSAASQAEGFSGAELEQVVIEGLHKAFAAKRELTTEDLELSVREVVPLSKTMGPQLDALRQWATTRARLAGSDPAKAISVPLVKGSTRKVDIE